jgi:hypothetical protein
MSMPRWTKIVAGALLALVLLFLALLVAVAVLLQHLDHPRLKPRIVGAVESATGLQLDYQTAHISLTSGLRLTQLVVSTPAPYDAVAPELLRVGRVEADWTLGDLLFGPVRVARLAVHDVALAWVADESGANSLSVLASGSDSESGAAPPEPEAEPESPAGATRQLAALFSTVPPVGQIEVSGVSLDYVQVRAGTVVDRWSVRGLGLQAQVLRDGASSADGAGTASTNAAQAGGWTFLMNMGQPDAPQILALLRGAQPAVTGAKTGAGTGTGGGPAQASAELALSLTVQASAAGAQAEIDLGVQRQNFDTRIPALALLRGKVTAVADATRQGLAIELHPTRLADSAEAQARLFLPDDASLPVVVSQARAEADLARLLRLVPADLRPLTLERGRLHLNVVDLALEPGGPQASPAHRSASNSAGSSAGPSSGSAASPRTRALLTLEADAARARVEAEMNGGELRWTAHAQTPDLVLARPFLPEEVAARLSWRQLGVNVQSQGRVEAVWTAAPRVTHRTEFRLSRLAWEGRVAAQELAAVLESEGDAWQHKGEVQLRAEGLRLEDQDAGAQRHRLTFDVDRKPTAAGEQKFDARIQLSSQAGLQLGLDAALAFDPQVRALRGSLKAQWPAQQLPAGLRAQLPAALDIARLAVDVDAQGTLTGVITALSADSQPQFAPDPLTSAGFEGQALVHARGLRWRQDDLVAQVPDLQWRLVSPPATQAGPGARRQLTSTVTAERARITLAERGLTATGLSLNTVAGFGANPEDEPEFALQLKVASLEQRPALPYPVRQLEWQVRARRDADGAYHLSEFTLAHAATRTHVAAQGRLDLAPERRRLALKGVLTQDIAGLNQPGVIEGRGRASVDFDLASPDLNTFRTQSSLRLEGVHLHLIGPGVVVEELDGDIPVYEDLRWTGSGVQLLDNLALNPYAMLRYTDQYPLLSRGGYVSARSITTPMARIAPLAGNLTIRQNVFAMTQLEMGVRNGRVTGQSRLDWRGRDSVLELRVRATGVQSTHGEPFDGNVAVVITARDRSVNGRAEILRIGSRHLLDLLDLADPHAADPSINRVRFALGLGYPEHVRLRFDQGFGRALIRLGGAAGLIRIDEIRGIPMGPIVDRALNSMQLTTE